MIPNQLIKGFSLVEMAIVLIIVGFLTSALFTPIAAQRNIKDISDTRQALEVVKEAIYGFAIVNGRLPCPTSEPDPSNQNYGVENCSLTGEAFLPWKTLGIPEGDAWLVHRTSASDAWTGYWRYRVDVNFSSSTTSFSTNILSSTPTFPSALVVKDSSGNSLTPTSERPIAIVYSFGKNLVADGQNLSPADNIYQSNEITTTFDDQLIWITRPVLVNRLAIASKLP